MEIAEANSTTVSASGKPGGTRARVSNSRFDSRAGMMTMARLDSTVVKGIRGLPAWKRLLDLGLILLLSPFVLLVGATVALVIKSGSRGPVFFRQRRVGFRGQEFVCFKFRTMRAGAETESHRDHTRRLMLDQIPMTKLDAQKDPRLIPFATALRATGLDELPQLINVFLGEMSIVGPRPCMPYEYELYQPAHRRRFDAVPGLTGLWQVSGKNQTTFEEMIQLDVEYSKRMSLGLDLRIILKTLPALWAQCHEVQVRRRQESATRTRGANKPFESYRL